MGDKNSGVVLISREPVDAELVAAVRKLGPYRWVVVGSLGTGRPDLREAVDTLLSRGVERILLVPLLTCRLAVQDVGALAEELAHQRSLHPATDFVPLQATLAPEVHARLLLGILQQQADSQEGEEDVPLSALAAHESGTVRCLNGGHELVSRLSALGFVPGSALQIVQNFDIGPLIVAVRGTRIALGREEARRVRVRPAAGWRPRGHAGRRRRHWGIRQHE